MDSFNNSFLNIVNEKEPYDKVKFYDNGIDLLLNNNITINDKEKILNKLIFIFPDDYKLYYYMGYIFKDIDIFKALTWFKLCFEKNKYYIENLLDFTKILFENNLYQYIIQLNKNNFFDQFDDERLIILKINLLIENREFKEAEERLLSIIHDNKVNYNTLYKVYANLAYLYNQKVDFDKVFFYLDLALDLIVKNNLKKYEIIKAIINDIFIAADYVYLDYNKIQILNKSKHILNIILPNTYDYIFENKIKNKKIRVGYVSYDFQEHAVSNFILPIINNHNKDNFEVFLFNNNIKNNNLNNNNYNLININNLNTIDACNLIYNKNIDILFDLGGHTEGNRLDIFSKNPAPIQISYLGFPNSTRLNSIKYRITDTIADNINSTQQYSENLLYLPKCFLLFRSLLQDHPFPYRNVDMNNIILGSLNRENKISKEVILLWKSILNQHITSKILIKINGKNNLEDKIKEYSQLLNIDSSRLILLNKVSSEDYVNLYNKIDILLDTFPYCGTTTTCNALYNSIPVVTLYNQNIHSHNVSASLLINSDLKELVALDSNEYINIVLDLCNNIDKLNHYKKIIHDKFDKLMNIKDFMSDYEKLLNNIMI